MNETIFEKKEKAEDKAKQVLEQEYGFSGASEMLGYIRYLEDIKADYEQLKERVKSLVSFMDSLY